jgi:gliding motility-associated-like protein
VLIVVEIVCGDVFVPNIFSPNGVGDPENEQLCVYGNCIRDLRFRIFNRWGQMIFETIDPTATECWDGTFKGKAMMTGTYVYTLYVETFDNEVIEKSGNITLVR